MSDYSELMKKKRVGDFTLIHEMLPHLSLDSVRQAWYRKSKSPHYEAVMQAFQKIEDLRSTLINNPK